MLSLPASVRIFVCLQPADMRRSFDGLSAMVSQVLAADPQSGHLFVFRNKRGDRLKILYWDRDGFALWYKRLEEGVFRFAAPSDNARVEWTPAELAAVLEGIDVGNAKRRKRYGGLQ